MFSKRSISSGIYLLLVMFFTLLFPVIGHSTDYPPNQCVEAIIIDGIIRTDTTGSIQITSQALQSILNNYSIVDMLAPPKNSCRNRS